MSTITDKYGVAHRIRPITGEDLAAMSERVLAILKDPDEFRLEDAVLFVSKAIDRSLEETARLFDEYAINDALPVIWRASVNPPAAPPSQN